MQESERPGAGEAAASARRRVLIVVSSYAPTMIADMHRARHLAWELPALGWDVEILAPDTSFQHPSCLDEDSGAFFSPGTPVTYVPSFARATLDRLGVGSIGWRALAPLWQAGRRLLRQKRFDLVYISTTHFQLFLLGPIWRAACGVPYVLDFHDPLYKDKNLYRAWLKPGLKHAMARSLFHFIERRAVMPASGIVAVSPLYIEDLRRRYQAAGPPWLKKNRTAVIPFGVAPHDLAVAGGADGAAAAADDSPRIVYVGSGGAIMRRSFELFCQALAAIRDRGWGGLPPPRIELYGTLRGWREGAPKELVEVAASHGVGDLVSEAPGWISYRRSLELLMQSDGALILGVDDAGYMPSKLFTYAYSGKPLLAMLRREGAAYGVFEADAAMGHTLWFSAEGLMPLDKAAQIVRRFLEEAAQHRRFDRRSVIGIHDTAGMALRHTELFADVCGADGQTSAHPDAEKPA